MFNLVSMNRRWVISMLVMLGICLIGSCDRPKIVVVRVTEPTLNATVAGVRVVYLKNNFTEVFVNNADTLASAITDSNGEAIFENISGKSNEGTYSFRCFYLRILLAVITTTSRERTNWILLYSPVTIFDANS